MGVDATARAEVMLCGVGVELVNGEQFAALSNVDAVQIRRHRNRPAHATVRTRTTSRRTKPIGQPYCEPNPTALAGAVDRMYGGLHPRLLIRITLRSARRPRVECERPLCSPPRPLPRNVSHGQRLAMTAGALAARPSGLRVA